MAPGVSILAAIMPKSEPGSIPSGKKPSEFALKSGTSMACPHVTGAAAFIKSVHRGWTSSMIRSALMTTGISSQKVESSANILLNCYICASLFSFSCILKFYSRSSSISNSEI